MRTLECMEIGAVSGGNARDTVTGSFDPPSQTDRFNSCMRDVAHLSESHAVAVVYCVFDSLF